MSKKRPTKKKVGGKTRNRVAPIQRSSRHYWRRTNFCSIQNETCLCFTFCDRSSGWRSFSFKKNQVENLFTKQRPFFAFDRTKRGAKEQKAFLSQEGKEIISQRTEDYKLVIKYSKPKNDFLFATKQSENDHLSRQHFTAEINRYLKILGEKHNRKFSSHSFRKGHITHLWKNLHDLKLVSLMIGHVSMCTTERYIVKPSEDEMQAKMNSVRYATPSDFSEDDNQPSHNKQDGE
uniref:Putative DNA breaking-rejoining enzyme n=1 Tax=Sarcinofilum mucosum TaxID=141643 RepID=A0A1W6EGE5_SARMC|nr:putative DNA breaking-rejoining enzyme [Sarcinofilum mucosum]ARK14462.1 putative DNA breaking-rejoining enzyme [Sarcinofilum mucosum]